MLLKLRETLHHPFFAVKILLLLKYPYIIHHHPLRKLGCTIRAAGPVTPYSNIENEKEWIIKRVII
jgi:hypothetical protein